MGPATSTPAAWELPVVIDLTEQRARLGIHIDGDQVSLPRTAVEVVTNLRRRPLPRVPPTGQRGLSAGFVFTDELAELLGFAPDEDVLHINMNTVSHERLNHGIWDFMEARRALLQDPVATVVTTERTVTLHIDGAPVALPDGWESGQTPTTLYSTPGIPGITDTEPRRLTRLQLRRYIDPAPTCSPTRNESFACSRTHPLWRALAIIPPRRLAIDGAVVASESAVADWLGELCESTGDVSFTLGNVTNPEQVWTYELSGPNTPCP